MPPLYLVQRVSHGPQEILVGRKNRAVKLKLFDFCFNDTATTEIYTLSLHDALPISLANTGEPLFLLNRSGNRPSQERAGEYLNKGVTLCIRAGFRKILLRGDTRIAENKDLDPWDEQILPRDGTTIAETANLDSWDDAENIRFIFGYAAYDILKARADELPAHAYGFLERPPRYTIKTSPRQQPDRVKPEIVRGHDFKTI